MSVFDWIIAGALAIGGLLILLAILKAVLSPLINRGIIVEWRLASFKKALIEAQSKTIVNDAKGLEKLFYLSTNRVSASAIEKIHEYNIEVLSFIVSRAPSARGLPNLNIVEELFYNRFILFQQLEKAHSIKAKINAYNNKVKKTSFESTGAISDIKESLEVNKRSLKKEISTLLSSLDSLMTNTDATIN